MLTSKNQSTTSAPSMPSGAPDAPDDLDFALWFGGRWLSYDAFKKAQLDRIMPPQPKREWGRR